MNSSRNIPIFSKYYCVTKPLKKNIFWATENYQHLGDAYKFNSEILFDSITGENGNIIMPRVYKDKVLQLSRSKEMAEVFTPSWICNDFEQKMAFNWISDNTSHSP